MLAEKLVRRVKMENKKRLPKLEPLPGAVCKQYRPYKGRQLGPYYFRFWKEDGQQRKEYVRPRDLETVRKQCAIFREERQRRIAGTAYLKSFSQLLREMGL